MDLHPPRGTADLVPRASERMRALYGRAAALAELYGYRYVETPAIESTELFARTAGATSEVVGKEMYTFTDRGGRSLTLRPEGTAPVVRAYLANAHDLGSPFKAFYLEPEWRYGRPQSGRLREFRVFGVEVLGAPDAAADVEVIAVADRFLRTSGLERLELQVSSIGDDQCRPAYREELVAYLESRRELLTDEHRDRLADNPMRVLDCKDPACRAVSEGAPTISDRLCGPCGEHFEAVRSGLHEEGIAHLHEPRLVRGLDYYTRTAFEFVSSVLSEGQATVCGGGRYDGLAEVLGGPRTPGVGFGVGLDRVAMALEKEGVHAADTGGPECFVVAVGAGSRAWAARVARALRDTGVPTALSFEARPLKAQLRMAARSGARFAVIVGEQESLAGTVTLRRLSDGHQVELGLDKAAAWLLSSDDADFGGDR